MKHVLYYFSFLHLLVSSRMVPQSVNSLMIRLLVPDASPDKPIENGMQIKQAEAISTKHNDVLTNSVTNLNHRTATGKNV